MTPTFDLAETDRLLTTTRAVRRRLDLQRPVPREVVLECLRVATQAPTGGNRQPWRWLVVDDPEQRAALGPSTAAGSTRTWPRNGRRWSMQAVATPQS